MHLHQTWFCAEITWTLPPPAAGLFQKGFTSLHPRFCPGNRISVLLLYSKVYDGKLSHGLCGRNRWELKAVGSAQNRVEIQPWDSKASLRGGIWDWGHMNYFRMTLVPSPFLWCSSDVELCAYLLGHTDLSNIDWGYVTRIQVFFLCIMLCFIIVYPIVTLCSATASCNINSILKKRVKKIKIQVWLSKDKQDLLKLQLMRFGSERIFSIHLMFVIHVREHILLMKIWHFFLKN